MRISMVALGAATLMLSSAAARAQEPAAGEPPPPPMSPRPKAPVPDELRGRLVVVTTEDGPVEGKLIAVSDDEVEVETYTADHKIIDRASILEVRLRYTGAYIPVAPSSSRVSGRRDPSWRDTGADIPVARTVNRGVVVDEPPIEAQEAPGRGKSSPWGFWGSLGLGPVWGQPTGSAHPTFMISVDLAASFHFVYAGTGLLVTWFGGVDSFSNDTTGGVRSSGAPASVGAYIEAGLTKGIFFPYSPTSAFELRPGIGYGLAAMSAAEQGIDHCVDCDTRSFDYGGGQYVRFQLGAFHATHPAGFVDHQVFTSRTGPIVGGTVSFQEFVLGAGPRLNHALTFALTAGWSP